MTYKKGDYIKVMTNQPELHISMVVNSRLSCEDVKPSEYTARVMSIIGNDEAYLIFIPSIGFRCVVDASEVLRIVSEDELTDAMRDYEDDLEFNNPRVYIYKKEYQGRNNMGRSLLLAITAMAELHPAKKIVSVERCHSDFLKSDLLATIDKLIKRRCKNNKAIQKKRDYFKDMLEHLRFREYYNVRVGVEDEQDEKVTNYIYLAVDTKFEEVAMSPYDCRFVRNLGPEYDSINNYFNNLRTEILSEELI
jgi:hypothetical protein